MNRADMEIGAPRHVVHGRCAVLNGRELSTNFQTPKPRTPATKGRRDEGRSLDWRRPWLNLPFMSASENQVSAEAPASGSAMHQAAPPCGAATDGDIDLSLLDDSLAKTPWERMQANDDALRFADSLRAAMEKRNAKP
jgi:hypothetical protein